MQTSFRKHFFLLILLASVHTQSALASSGDELKESLSAWGVAKLFVSSLFEPFINEEAQTFYTTQASSFAQDPTGYVSDKAVRIGTAVYEHPDQAASLAGAVLLGWTDLAEVAPVVPGALQLVQNAKIGKQFYDQAKSIKGEKLLDKGLKVALMGGAVYMVANLPAAAAFNSLADAKAHYSGGPCHYEDVSSALICLRDGAEVDTCVEASFPEGTSVDIGHYVFTRHPSTNSDLDPVSVTHFHINQTCFQTALTPTSPVTQLCFGDLNDPHNHTLSVLPDVSLSRGHEGLEPGQSVHFFSVTKTHAATLMTGLRDPSCGGAKQGESITQMGEEAVCVLTALKPGDDVTQLCYDPTRPGALTLKKPEGVELTFPDDGKPASLVVVKPTKAGLDITPDRPVSLVFTKSTTQENAPLVAPDTPCNPDQAYVQLKDCYGMLPDGTPVKLETCFGPTPSGPGNQ